MRAWARLAAVALACSALPVAAADKAQLDALRSRIDRLHEEIAGAEESRAELAAMALTDSEKQSLSAELTALDQIDEWMRGA